MEEKVVKVEEADLQKIVETREPHGLFYAETKNGAVGVDNRTGDAWTEEFPNKEACERWLHGNE